MAVGQGPDRSSAKQQLLVGGATYGAGMAKVTVKVNDDGIRRLYEEIATKIDAADRAFRNSHEGFPLEVVEADARTAIPGVELDNDTLHRYAVAVTEGAPFQFELR